MVSTHEVSCDGCGSGVKLRQTQVGFARFNIFYRHSLEVQIRKVMKSPSLRLWYLLGRKNVEDAFPPFGVGILTSVAKSIRIYGPASPGTPPHGSGSVWYLYILENLHAASLCSKRPRGWLQGKFAQARGVRLFDLLRHQYVLFIRHYFYGVCICCIITASLAFLVFPRPHV